MVQLSNDCFSTGRALLRLVDAIRIMGERVDVVAGSETVALTAADGRVLAADVVAPIDLPSFDNSAVDGYAVRFADLAATGETVLPVQGRVAAGRDAGSAPAPRSGHATRIFTGAAMPAGFDTVFMQEDVVLAPEGVRLPAGLEQGANRRRAGEDVGRGALVLAAGRRLTPSEIALLGALGLAKVEARTRLRVAIASTGDEVVEPGRIRGATGLYDANRPMLAAALGRLGCAVTDLGILPDRRDTVATALAEAAEAHDLIVTSGGVSVGEEDHVKDAVEAAGALDLWRIAVKPGRPVALGIVAGTPFVGLPGNPVAAFVTFAFVARHLVARLQGEAYRAPIPLPVEVAFAHAKREGLREFVRVRLDLGANGRPAAAKHPQGGAAIISSLTQSDGIVVLPEETVQVVPGDEVGFIPFSALV